MRHLIKFLRQNKHTKLLLLRAIVRVAIVRAAISRTSFNLVGTRRPNKRSTTPFSPEQIAWAVERAARLVPGATCLTQASAGRYLLELYGYSSRIRVGVRIDDDAKFVAHAWLICGDAVVLGGDYDALSRYRFLTDLDPIASS